MKSSDLDLILEWRNHPDIRKKMFNQEKIEQNEHKRWFKDERGF